MGACAREDARMTWYHADGAWTSAEPGRYTAKITGGPPRYSWHIHVANGVGVGNAETLADAKLAVARALRTMEAWG